MPRIAARSDRANRSRSRQPRGLADRPSALQLLLRRQKRFLRPLLGVGVGLCVVLVGYTMVRSASSNSHLDSLQFRIGRAIDMKIRNVVVEGRQNTPEPLLRAALGVSPGDPMFGFSVDQARSRIESLSWVQHVAVERRLPGTVVVSLTEKSPFAIWQSQGKFQLIDRKGQIVTNEDIGGFGNLPLVVGNGAPDHAAVMLDKLAKVPALQSHVTALVRVGDRRWNLHLNNGADVMLPEGAEDAAISKLMELQSSEDLLDRPLAVIDMRLPDRLVIRPVAESHSDPHQVSHPAPHADQHALPAAPTPKRST